MGFEALRLASSGNVVIFWHPAHSEGAASPCAGMRKILPAAEMAPITIGRHAAEVLVVKPTGTESMSLLHEIESDASSSSIPLPDLLRKCKVLAARLKHQELADWLTKELSGYQRDDELPSYRKLHRGPSLGHFSGAFGRMMRNAPISPEHVPEKYRMLVTEYVVRDSVASIASLTTGSQVWKWPATLIAYMANNHTIYDGYVLIDAWSPIPSGHMQGIVDTVRTRVLDFVLAIHAENPEAGEAAPNEPPPMPLHTVTYHFNTTIIGGMANVGNHGPSSISDVSIDSVVNTQNNGAIDTTVRQYLNELRETAAGVPDAEERAEAESTLQKVEVQLAKPKPDLQRIQSYLAIFQNIVAIAGPSVSKLIQYLGPHLASLM